MEFDYQTMEDKFKQLPQNVQLALTSTKVADEIKDISDRYGLHVDQEGILFDQTAHIMLGLMPSNQFVANFSREAKVDAAIAKLIAEELNAEVFGKIRSSMQNYQKSVEDQSSTPATDARKEAAALERAGNFSVEPSLASSSADGEEPAPELNEVKDDDKNDILSGIENPTPSRITSTPKPEEEHIEPLVDHLLGTSSAQTEQKVVHKVEEPPVNLPTEEKMPESKPVETPQKPIIPPVRPTPPPRKGPDPYRESPM